MPWDTSCLDSQVFQWIFFQFRVYLRLFKVNLMSCSNPRKFLYQASVVVSGLNILYIRFITSQMLPVMAMLVIFNVLSAITSAGILMMSNLLYQDYFNNRNDLHQDLEVWFSCCSSVGFKLF